MSIKKNIFHCAVAIVSMFLLIPAVAKAVTFEAIATPESVGIVQEVEIALYVDTEGRAINALSAEVEIKGGGTITRISDGDSIVGAWLTQAQAGNATTSFSGIIPRGIRTVRGKVLTLYVTPTTAGKIEVVFGGKTFENSAQSAPVKIPETAVLVAVSPSPQPLGAPLFVDATPPQIVRAIIATNEAMFDGKPFLFFEAKDTESGILALELLETKSAYALESLRNDTKLPWQRIKSPALLSGAPEVNFTYIRATDREGNVTVALVGRNEQLSTENGQSSFNKWLIFGIFSVVTVLLLWVLRRRKKFHE